MFNEGKSIKEAAQMVGVNESTARSIIRRTLKDGVLSKKCGGIRNRKLTDDILGKIERIVEENHNITLKCIQQMISESDNLKLSFGSLRNALKSMRITSKRTVFDVDRLNAPLTVEQRKEYALNFAQNAPPERQRIIFIDESGFNYHLRKPISRSPVAEERHISVIAAMNLNGIVLTKVFANSCIHLEMFCVFLRDLFAQLNEIHLTEAWLVLDNAQIHKSPMVRDLVAKTTHRLVYLPPFSPMFNPIESVFANAKLIARDMLGVPLENRNIVDVIKESVDAVTPADCNNFYLEMTEQVALILDVKPMLT